MLNYQKYQINEFGQKIGKTVVREKPKKIQEDILVGNYVRLFPIHNDILQTSAFSALWKAIESEPDHACWTYLPYSTFSFQVQLEQALKKILVLQRQDIF